MNNEDVDEWFGTFRKASGGCIEAKPKRKISVDLLSKLNIKTSSSFSAGQSSGSNTESKTGKRTRISLVITYSF